MRFYIFMATILIVVGLINYYNFRSFKARFLKFRVFYKAFFIALTLINFAAFFSFKTLSQGDYLALVLNSSVAITFMIFTVCVAFDVLTFISLKAMPKKEKSIKKYLNLAFTITTLLYIFGGFYEGSKKPTPKFTHIKIDGLKEELALAVLADIHLAISNNQKFLSYLVDSVNAIEADALLIAGDMFDITAPNLGTILDPLEKVEIPVFFVTGNHEFYMGAKPLVDRLKGFGVRVLENESVEFRGINLVGVHDKVASKFGYLAPDIDTALSYTNRDIPTIMLIHQPRFIYENFRGEVDLYISGHTHGGQIFPFNIVVKLYHKYINGLYKKDNSYIYVSSGAGYWGMPIRVFAPARIDVLKLKPSNLLQTKEIR